MKRFMTLLIAVTVLLLACETTEEGDSGAINAIIGDASFVAAFGTSPTKSTDEKIRIRTHLAHVENLLRNRDVSHLPDNLQRKRSKALDLLRDYRIAGKFPRNYDHKNKRVPCFIDITGNICAVGYLIEQTAGRALADAINEKFKYSEILSMRDEAVDQWIAQSGLTKEECAMIQPSYSWDPDRQPQAEANDIPAGYALTSSVSTGINLSLSTLNAIQLGQGAQSPAVGIISLGAGAGAILFGALNLPRHGEPQNYRKQTLSIVNIGVGATNLVLGISNLVSNRPRKRKSIAWNVYTFPEPGNQSGIGLSLTRKIGGS